jgi:hypothetical protein
VGRPFWYCGVLNVYHMHPNETRMDLWADGGLEKGKKAFNEIADRLAGEGGGLISIFYHPCEWVHVEFWDGVNFRRGANPPREQWKAPPQRPAEQTEAAFERFAAYVDAMKARPGVRFVTARELPGLYPDPVRKEGASEEEVLGIARATTAEGFKGLDDVTVGGKVFSPAEQFAALAIGVARLIDPEQPDAGGFSLANLLGPDGAPPALPQEARGPLTWFAFRDAARDVANYVRVNRRVPARVFIGPDPVAPADFAVGLAAAYLAHHESGRFPETVALGSNVEVLTAARVAKDAPNLFGGWIIHKANFRAPKLLDVARLQAWTLKPATRRTATDHEAARN